ncbi:MAG: ABC transporter ATP-binding protein, partial [Spirochaetaceae bacterium]|nr:ABC transporter ATP-binding protein [Spirochaetaceae bacterium]
GSEIAIGGRIFLRDERIAALSIAQRDYLEGKGLLDPAPRYLLRIEPSDAIQARALAAEGAMIESEGEWAAIAMADLRRLDGDVARALRSADTRTIASGTLLLLISLAAAMCASFVQAVASNTVGLRVMKDLRMRLFRHASTRSLSYLSRQPVGRLVTRMTSDVETINQFFSDVLLAFAKDGTVMIGVLCVLFALDAKLALIMAATLPPVAVATVISRTRARDAFRRQRRALSRVNSYIAERISGIAVVALFAREEASRREFEAHDRELMRASLGEMYVFAVFRPVVDFLSSTSTAVVIWAGAALLGAGSLSLGTLVAFANLVRMFYSPVIDLAEKYTMLQSAMAGGERVFALLDEGDSIPDEPKAAAPSPVRGEIAFESVRFGYKEDEPVLRDLSFRVRAGESVAIVGATGAGKTTVANLMTRLWDPQGGRITLDGLPVRDLPLRDLRRSVQPVLQELFLFSGTIEDNIRLGDEVSRESMIAAARAVCADEFIERLPGGYQARLAEGGTNLSQGQRQLVSFARVLARDPAVIVLDEATSSIDTETEILVRRGMEALMRGRTSIAIAHRLSTIRHADRIIVLSRGTIAEQGTHDELIALGGIYWNLYRLQVGGETEEP